MRVIYFRMGLNVEPLMQSQLINCFLLLFSILVPSFLFGHSGLNELSKNPNNKISEKSKTTIALIGSSEVVVSVNWPTWSSDNQVEIFAPGGGTPIATICNPSTCFDGSINNSYSTSLDLGCLTDGTGYYLMLADSYGDGWGAGTVTVTSGGVTVINALSLSSATSGPHTFDVSGGGASCCSVDDSGLAVSSCDDNNTMGNINDDSFTFTLNPTGSGIGSTYSVSGDVAASGISYGSSTTFNNGGNGYLISNGNLSITITDDATGGCQMSGITVTAPSSCSTCTVSAPTPQSN